MKLKISRRSLLVGGTVVGAGVALSPFINLGPIFKEFASADGNPPLPSPGVTGTLSAGNINTLFTIADYAGQKWGLSASSAFDASEFQTFVNYKTTIVPSYYTAYQQALALYNALVQQLGSADKAMEYLYTPNPATPPANWDVVRFWAIQEYLLLYVISGSFRAYGWLNYPGWMGAGPYNDPAHLPYRGMTGG